MKPTDEIIKDIHKYEFNVKAAAIDFYEGLFEKMESSSDTHFLVIPVIVQRLFPEIPDCLKSSVLFSSEKEEITIQAKPA